MAQGLISWQVPLKRCARGIFPGEGLPIGAAKRSPNSPRRNLYIRNGHAKARFEKKRSNAVSACSDAIEKCRKNGQCIVEHTAETDCKTSPSRRKCADTAVVDRLYGGSSARDRIASAHKNPPSRFVNFRLFHLSVEYGHALPLAATEDRPGYIPGRRADAPSTVPRRRHAGSGKQRLHSVLLEGVRRGEPVL